MRHLFPIVILLPISSAALAAQSSSEGSNECTVRCVLDINDRNHNGWPDEFAIECTSSGNNC